MAALITFKVDIDMKTGQPTNDLTQEAIDFFKKEAGVEVKTSEEAVKNPKIFECI